MKTIDDFLTHIVDFEWVVEERPTRFYIHDHYTKELLLDGVVENLRRFSIPPVKQALIVDIQFRGPDGVLQIPGYRLNPKAEETIIDIIALYEYKEEKMSS